MGINIRRREGAREDWGGGVVYSISVRPPSKTEPLLTRPINLNKSVFLSTESWYSPFWYTIPQNDRLSLCFLFIKGFEHSLIYTLFRSVFHPHYCRKLIEYQLKFTLINKFIFIDSYDLNFGSHDSYCSNYFHLVSNLKVGHLRMFCRVISYAVSHEGYFHLSLFYILFFKTLKSDGFWTIRIENLILKYDSETDIVTQINIYNCVQLGLMLRTWPLSLIQKFISNDLWTNYWRFSLEKFTSFTFSVNIFRLLILSLIYLATHQDILSDCVRYSSPMFQYLYISLI